MCPGFDDGIDTDGDGVPDGCDDCPDTPAGVPVTLAGCATSTSDFDRDGDVDQSDFGHLQACYTGSGQPCEDSLCLDARLDSDTDVDQDDFAILQQCMSGPNIPVILGCDGEPGQ